MQKCENPGTQWLVYNQEDKAGARKGRVYLLYTGQHYDPIRLSPGSDGKAVSSVLPIKECVSKFEAATFTIGQQALQEWVFGEGPVFIEYVQPPPLVVLSVAHHAKGPVVEDLVDFLNPPAGGGLGFAV